MLKATLRSVALTRVLNSWSIRHHSSVPNAIKITIIKEGSIQAELEAGLAKTYKKDSAFDQDLSIEVFNLFAKTITTERKARYESKLIKYHAEDTIDKKKPDPATVGISILDPGAGNGVRVLRYMKEVQGLRHITANDWTVTRGEALAHNMALNNITPAQVSITQHSSERVLHEYVDSHRNLDVIDLQSLAGELPAHLDTAVQATAMDGGLLCISSANIQSLAANASEACFGRYGSAPVRTHYGKEVAIRTILHAVDAAANKHKRNIQPWLSLCHGDSVRIFVRVWKSPSGALVAMQNRVMLHHSTLCHSHFYNRLSAKNKLENAYWPEEKSNSSAQESTDEAPATDALDSLFGANSITDPSIDALFGDTPTNTPTKSPTNTKNKHPPTVFDLPELTGVPGRYWQTGGPFWGAELHNQDVVEALFAKFKAYEFQNPRGRNGKNAVRKPETTARQLALLATVVDELKDVPFSYDLHSMCALLQCNLPSQLEVMSAVENAGYRVSNFHADQQALKTDAPSDVMWDILKVHSVTRANGSKGANPAAAHILARAPVLKEGVCFDLTRDIKRRMRDIKKYSQST